MAGRSGRLGESLAQARRTRISIGVEVREARLAGGVSQQAAATSVGMSHAQFGRIERGELRNLTIEQVVRAYASVGLRLAAKPYPAGEPIRDAGQLQLLDRFRAVLPPVVRWRTEVPMPIAGDLRAWDAVAIFPDGTAAIEAETRIRDVQAIDRRIALKRRDAGIGIVLLVVSDTEANRAAIRAARTSLRANFPLDPRGPRSGSGRPNPKCKRHRLRLIRAPIPLAPW
jgi:transcriptional regulator with XRE-family HTH domain